MKTLLAFVLAIASGITFAAESPKVEVGVPKDGVFLTRGWHSIVLELKGGKFRYWFVSDAKIKGLERKYPLEGSYKTEGDKITLEHPTMIDLESNWTVRTVDGVTTLWRQDALEIWKKGELQIYSPDKGHFLGSGAGSILVPTKRSAEEAWGGQSQ